MEIKTSEEIAAELNKVYGNADELNKSYGKIKWVAVDDLIKIINKNKCKVNSVETLEGELKHLVKSN